jgi:RHS repeat-associated protein
VLISYPLPAVLYDEVGRVVARYYPFFTDANTTNVDAFLAPPAENDDLATTYTYDNRGRLVSTLYPDGAEEEVAFSIAAVLCGASPNVYKTRSTAGNGNLRDSYTDGWGRMVAFVEFPDLQNLNDTAVSCYSYNGAGELVQIKDDNNNTTTIEYDLRGLRTEIDNPDTGTLELVYDKMGNVVRRIDPNHSAASTHISYLYNRDRLEEIDYPAKTDVAFTYGTTGYQTGRVEIIEDESGSQTFTYGEMGEVTHHARTVRRDPDDPLSFHTRTMYDSFGRVLEMTYPDGEKLSYSYDHGGKVNSVEGEGTGWSTTYLTDLQYDELGRRTRAEFGDALVTTWSYDAESLRLSTLYTENGTTDYQNLSYTYDLSGNPTQIVSGLSTPTAGSRIPGGGTWIFGYDGVDRLVEASGTQTKAPIGGVAQSTNYSQGFSYDKIHNITQKTRVHVEVSGNQNYFPPETNLNELAYTYSTTRPHQPLTIGEDLYELSYDASGNLLEILDTSTSEAKTMVWDDDNRLVQTVANTREMNYSYDSSGIRVRKEGEYGETIFASAFFDVTNEASNQSKHIFVDGIRLASVTDSYTESDGTTPPVAPGRLFYFLQDHLGSSSLLVAEGGEIQEHLEYFPDGEVWIDQNYASINNGYRFTGKFQDEETGFYDHGQRFYDPRTSLWLGVDPLFADGPDNVVGRPMVMALYGYAAHSPLRFIDPDGRDIEVKGPNKKDLDKNLRKMQRWAGDYATLSYAAPNQYGNVQVVASQTPEQIAQLQKDQGTAKAAAASALLDAINDGSYKILIIDVTPRLGKTSQEKKTDNYLRTKPWKKGSGYYPIKISAVL